MNRAEPDEVDSSDLPPPIARTGTGGRTMKHMIPVLVLAAMFATSTVQAETMNANPLGLKPTKSVSETSPNLVELRFGAGGTADYFGQASGPAVSAVFEHKMSDELSVGVELMHSTSKFSTLDFSGEYGYKYSNNTIFGRASYHNHDLIDDERVDLYGGGRLGYNKFSISAFGPGASATLGKTSYIVAGAFTGGRFWFNEKFGANLEAGYNYAMYTYVGYGAFSYGNISLGATMRF